MKYQPMNVPEDLFEAINGTNSFNNKMQVDHFGRDQFIVQDDHSDNNKDNCQTQCNKEDNFEDESYDELDNSHQLTGMKSYKIVD